MFLGLLMVFTGHVLNLDPKSFWGEYISPSSDGSGRVLKAEDNHGLRDLLPRINKYFFF